MDEVTNVSRFEWLRDYQNLHDELLTAQWELRKVHSESERLAEGDLSTKHYTGHIFVRNSEETKRWEKRVKECKQLLQELDDVIDSFTGLDNKILKCKYVDGLTLEQTAEQLHYSLDVIKKRHAELHKRMNWLDHFNDLQLQLANRKDGPTLADRDADEDTGWMYGK